MEKTLISVPWLLLNAALGPQPGMSTAEVAEPATRRSGSFGALALPVAFAQVTAAEALIVSGEIENAKPLSTSLRLLSAWAEATTNHGPSSKTAGVIVRFLKLRMLLAI